MRTKRIVKPWVRYAIFYILLTIILLILIFIDNHLKNEFLNNCQKQGYSIHYCIDNE